MMGRVLPPRHTRKRFDNPYCFYRQAVQHRRFDLLDEEPKPEEIAAADACPT